MTNLPSAPHSASRRGSALLIAVVALALVSVVTAVVTSQCLAARQLLQRRQHQLQAEWLARAGVELAADRLLGDATGYKGESVELIPGGKVRLDVRAEPGATDVFRVTSSARFPGDGRDSDLCSTTRTFRRTSRGSEVRLEVVADRRSASKEGKAHAP
jgi:hypothetical protein